MNDSTQPIDCLIFGAGPAGLAAAHAQLDLGSTFTVVELGASVDRRGRHAPADLVTGVGGAGLYSDGKFSFYPSASALWRLPDEDRLRRAYDWFTALLDGIVQVPDFPDTHVSSSTLSKFEKRYVSETADFPTRAHLINRMSKTIGSHLMVKHTVTSFSISDGIVLAHLVGPNGESDIRARAAIIAGGRFGMLEHLATTLPHVFRRYEFGVRIETNSDTFVFRDHPSLDPKYMWTDNRVEWRTFCTIRNGEVAETDFLGLVSCSGRSDVAPTHFSNVGFNVRFLSEPSPDEALSREARAVLSGAIQPFQVGLPEYLSGEVGAYGPHIDGALRAGILKFLEISDSPAHDLVATGPCVEGVGYYPDITSDLQSPELPVWIAGDQTGVFRGLTAAFVSGHYVGQAIHPYPAAQR